MTALRDSMKTLSFELMKIEANIQFHFVLQAVAEECVGRVTTIKQNTHTEYLLSLLI